MRVTTRLAVGSGLLIVVLIAVPWFGLTQVRRLVELQRELIGIELTAAVITLEQERLMPQLESLSRKAFVVSDEESVQGYVEKIEGLTIDFQSSLDRLRALDLPETVRTEVEELARLWSEIPIEGGTIEALQPSLAPEDETLLDDVFRDRMQEVREQLDRVFAATREAIAAKAARTLEDSRRAEFYSMLAVALTLALAVPVLVLTAWSIREPLRRLEEGTRGVTHGIYSYELDTSRGDEFSQLATSFNQMVARLGELDQMKRDFLSHVSHELKTPLVAMDETNRLMLDGLPGPLNEKQRKLLELNLEGSRRLADMISKLLDLARLEEHAVIFEVRSHDLVELVRKVAASFLARARELGVTLEVEAAQEPVLADCDADRLVQLVGNLIDNALKHSPSTSTVTVRVRPPAADTRARLEVLDHGPGVPDGEKDRIFEKFQQVGRPMTGGVGLGLAICREIVSAHQGEIWVEDNPGGGSVFIVALPAVVEDRKAQAG